MQSAIIEAYSQKIDRIVSIYTVEIVIFSLVLLAFFIGLLLLTWKILDMILDIVSLFTFLTPAEVEKEIEKCNNFLVTCFSEDYEIKLLSLENDKAARDNSFQAS